jgi:hypothetical protein
MISQYIRLTTITIYLLNKKFIRKIAYTSLLTVKSGNKFNATLLLWDSILNLDNWRLGGASLDIKFLLSKYSDIKMMFIRSE